MSKVRYPLESVSRIIHFHTAAAMKKTSEVEMTVQKYFASTIALKTASVFQMVRVNVMSRSMGKIVAFKSSQ